MGIGHRKSDEEQEDHRREADTGENQHEPGDNSELVSKVALILRHWIPLCLSFMNNCITLPSNFESGNATSNIPRKMLGKSQKITSPGSMITDGRLNRSTIHPPTFHHIHADSVENTTPMANEIAIRNRRDSRSRSWAARA